MMMVSLKSPSICPYYKCLMYRYDIIWHGLYVSTLNNGIIIIVSNDGKSEVTLNIVQRSGVYLTQP